ncbi:hypothetical protein CAPTEDRAFT_227322 [Capitella teleta]|uniref:Tumor necrosis factor receptor superfamily member 16 n=1 Tax=Capitella teleta TaxID=283909 RepID=R7V7N7_CAPTE|nr:hypothetical protein CAPTEDRAFT_227322 [Capitella teleta]|eukprot:ELU12391.1 hypothetical protein CAPTEDRAFT_227322 [Capitella teleta]
MLGRGFWFVLWLAAGAAADGGLTCPAGEHAVNSLQRCCTQCPVGKGVREACTATNDTVCEACAFGETFSGEKSHRQRCEPCALCPEYSYIKRVCNSTHNTVCLCDQNYFYDTVSRRCRHCDLCPEGFGVRRQCTSQNNTMCLTCLPGTYSERRSKNRCRPCRVCKANQVMLNTCTSKQNTVCVDIPDNLGTDPPEVIRGKPGTAAPEEVGESKRIDVIPIYCSVLGLLVLALLVCAVVQHRKRRLQFLRARKAELAQRNGSPSKDALSGLLKAEPPCQRPSRPQHSVADSGVYMEPECRPLTSLSLVRDIPPPRGRLLESMLQGGRDGHSWWSRLAHDLGYSASEIASIEGCAQHDAQTPLRFLLSDFGRQDSAIVGHLVDALRSIGRDDCVNALYGELRDFAPAPRYIDLASLQGQQII